VATQMKQEGPPDDPLAAMSALYWTVPEFAPIVNVSTKSVYRVAKDDPTFPCVWFGGSLRIPKERALRWLRDREQGSGPRRLRAVKREEMA
jgi:hypothetical protein